MDTPAPVVASARRRLVILLRCIDLRLERRRMKQQTRRRVTRRKAPATIVPTRTAVLVAVVDVPHWARVYLVAWQFEAVWGRR